MFQLCSFLFIYELMNVDMELKDELKFKEIMWLYRIEEMWNFFLTIKYQEGTKKNLKRQAKRNFPDVGIWKHRDFS